MHLARPAWPGVLLLLLAGCAADGAPVSSDPTSDPTGPVAYYLLDEDGTYTINEAAIVMELSLVDGCVVATTPEGIEFVPAFPGEVTFEEGVGVVWGSRTIPLDQEVMVSGAYPVGAGKGEGAAYVPSACDGRPVTRVG